MSRKALIALLILPCAAAFADSEGFRAFRSRRNSDLPGRFTFVRVEYDSYGGYGEAYYNYDGRTWQRWETDYPEADENFVYRLSELTTLDPNPRAITLRLTDAELFEHPMIYMCDVGWQDLSDAEVRGLRAYLERGGFLWVDDFWGYAEWDNFEDNMKKVFPELKWRNIGPDHEILSMVFELDSCPQVPAQDFARQGFEWDPPWIHKSGGVEQVHLRGWFDDKDRLMVVCTHNTDIGDGWEREAEDEWFFEKYSTRAYALGVNIVVYALSH